TNGAVSRGKRPFSSLRQFSRTEQPAEQPVSDTAEAWARKTARCAETSRPRGIHLRRGRPTSSKLKAEDRERFRVLLKPRLLPWASCQPLNQPHAVEVNEANLPPA